MKNYSDGSLFTLVVVEQLQLEVWWLDSCPRKPRLFQMSLSYGEPVSWPFGFPNSSFTFPAACFYFYFLVIGCPCYATSFLGSVPCDEVCVLASSCFVICTQSGRMDPLKILEFLYSSDCYLIVLLLWYGEIEMVSQKDSSISLFPNQFIRLSWSSDLFCLTHCCWF